MAWLIWNQPILRNQQLSFGYLPGPGEKTHKIRVKKPGMSRSAVEKLLLI
jgi:hypothetical protein